MARHDEVNSSIDVLLNFGGFMYIGAILPWSDFHAPDTTGITIGRLLADLVTTGSSATDLSAFRMDRPGLTDPDYAAHWLV